MITIREEQDLDDVIKINDNNDTAQEKTRDDQYAFTNLFILVCLLLVDDLTNNESTPAFHIDIDLWLVDALAFLQQRRLGVEHVAVVVFKRSYGYPVAQAYHLQRYFIGENTLRGHNKNPDDFLGQVGKKMPVGMTQNDNGGSLLSRKMMVTRSLSQER